MDYARLLPWLVWTLLTYACVGVAAERSRRAPTPADSEHSAVSHPKSGVQFDVDSLVYQEARGPDVVLVMDPNGVICWENIEVDELTNATLVDWLYHQHDFFTITSHDKTGTPLQMPPGLGPESALTFKDHIDQAWQSKATYIQLPSLLVSLFQMTLLAGDSDRDDPQTDSVPYRLNPLHLKLTNIDNFWKSVQMSAAMEKALPATANYSNSHQLYEPLLTSLENAIIILPRIVTMIRPVTKNWKATAYNHVWNDTVAWDRDVLVEMLARFVDITGTKTIPSLSEYAILPDKVKLQQMYQSYHDADPDHHTPPIPTAQVKIPLPTERLQELCYSELNSTESERSTVVSSLMHSLYQLEASVDMNSTVRQVVEGGGGDWMSQYMIKREFSEGSYHVFGITVPDLRSIQSVLKHNLSARQDHAEEVCPNLDAGVPAFVPEPTSILVKLIHKGQDLMRPLVPDSLARLQPVATLLGTCTDTIDVIPEKSKQRTCKDSAAIVGVQTKTGVSSVTTILPSPSSGNVVSHDTLGPANQICSHCPSADVDRGHVDCAHKDDSHHMAAIDQGLLPAEIASLLNATADRLLRESCGEGWLLQPRIADMTRLEYRVYMLNGAQAVNSSSDHSIVVYTPCLLDPEAGIRTFNITLPEGSFCSDVMVDPSEDLDSVNRGEFTQVKPWHSPDTYNMIIKAAQDGVQAIVKSPEGNLMRTISNVFIRMDIVLGAQWLNNDEVLLYPMINEMDWLNSAGMLATFWKEAVDTDADKDADLGLMTDLLKKSNGYKIAHALYKEVLSVAQNS